MCFRNVTEKVNKDGNITRVNKAARNYVFNFAEVKNINDCFKRDEIFPIYDSEGNLVVI